LGNAAEEQSSNAITAALPPASSPTHLRPAPLRVLLLSRNHWSFLARAPPMVPLPIV
jgi:hypothetical protein